MTPPSARISRRPQSLKVDDLSVRKAWYYEDEHGIDVIAEILDAGAYARTVSIRIPRRKLADWIKRTEKV